MIEKNVILTIFFQEQVVIRLDEGAMLLRKRLGIGKKTSRQTAAGMVSMRSPRRCRTVTPRYRTSCSTLSSIEGLSIPYNTKGLGIAETVVRTPFAFDQTLRVLGTGSVPDLDNEDRVTVIKQDVIFFLVSPSGTDNILEDGIKLFFNQDRVAF